jgi:hypothetical protein
MRKGKRGVPLGVPLIEGISFFPNGSLRYCSFHLLEDKIRADKIL